MDCLAAELGQNFAPEVTITATNFDNPFSLHCSCLICSEVRTGYMILFGWIGGASGQQGSQLLAETVEPVGC